MIRIEEIIAAFLQKPNKNLFINRDTSEIRYLNETDWEEYCWGQNPLEGEEGRMERWLCYEARSLNHIKDIRRFFLQEQGLDKEFDPKNLGKTALYNRFVEEKGLFPAYVDFYIFWHLSEIADFAFVNEIPQDEASAEDYRDIRALLQEYESYGFEKNFSDQNLFTLCGPGVYGTFVVLGNNAECFGISFYRGDNDVDQYRSFLRSTEEGMDESLSRTVATLLSTVALYPEKENADYYMPKEIKNPFGLDNRYTSISINRGMTACCYLDRLMARCLKEQLRMAIDALSILQRDNHGIDPAVPSHIFIDKKGKSFRFSVTSQGEADLPPEGPLADAFAHADAPLYPVGKQGRASWSFGLRGIFSAHIDMPDIRKAAQCYAALICDMNSGNILAPLAIAGEEQNTFLAALTKDMGLFQNLPVPKNIFVNSSFDYDLAAFLLAPYLKRGAKLRLVGEELPTDDAFAEMDRMMGSTPHRA